LLKIILPHTPTPGPGPTFHSSISSRRDVSEGHTALQGGCTVSHSSFWLSVASFHTHTMQSQLSFV